MEATAINTSLDTVNETSFLAVCRAYNKARRLVDVLAKSEDWESDVQEALQVIADFEYIQANGEQYTPAKRFDLGSDNASTIAETVLGRGKTASQVRSQVAKLGK